jgi:7-cyano-7-deazaguanine reductase
MAFSAETSRPASQPYGRRGLFQAIVEAVCRGSRGQRSLFSTGEPMSPADQQSPAHPRSFFIRAKSGAGFSPVTIKVMPKQRRYTPEHAEAGLDAKFPEIETWPNQFPGYEIVIDDPEFTSVCPKTGLPDFGVITIRYTPDKHCLELKSLKEYLYCYRNLGIFQENIVNRVLEDVVRCSKPVRAEVKGDFRPRGGISTTVVARWPRAK